MRKRTGDDMPINVNGWLTTYADMMNNLLVLFVALYAMSVMDLQKFQALAASLTSAFTGEYTEQTEAGGGTVGSDIEAAAEAALALPAVTEAEPKEEDEFDRIYAAIQKKIDESGLSDSIVLERTEEYIKFRFTDTVLFYPDSPVMRPESYDILKYMGDILLSVDNDIQSIEIGGHTATTNGGNTKSYFAWELSADRAISVLKFLSETCNLPQSKMSVSGYSHYQPVASNDNEQDRYRNRRVEIKIIRTT